MVAVWLALLLQQLRVLHTLMLSCQQSLLSKLRLRLEILRVLTRECLVLFLLRVMLPLLVLMLMLLLRMVLKLWWHVLLMLMRLVLLLQRQQRPCRPTAPA